MKHDNKNFILAIVLSMAIIFGWQYFYAMPQADRLAEQARQAEQATGQQPATPTAPSSGAPAGLVPGTTGAGVVPRDEALASSPRVK
ncbi:MAG: membrane protein insertase YidC, partial [Aestuariivirga sp.]